MLLYSNIASCENVIGMMGGRGGGGGKNSFGPEKNFGPNRMSN